MKVSASQLQTYERCPRLWWFDKVRLMPRSQQAHSQTYGKVLHSVLERYLDSDPSGRDPEGNPVNLYPEGWATDPESGFGVTEEEAQQIKDMVEEAIKTGMLARRPDGQVERHFDVTLLETKPLIDTVTIQGYIDYLTKDEVQDHKSRGRRRYIYSQERLATDTQMLIYAKVAGVTRVRHNNFVKEDGSVKPVSVEVPQEEIDAKWEDLKHLAGEMLALSKANLQDEDYSEVPSVFPSRACNSYGACPFIYVCGGEVAPAKYRSIKSVINNPPETKTEKKLPVAETTNVTVLHGVVVDKGSLGPQITISDLLRRIIESEDYAPEDYYKLNAFDRRDAIKQVVPKFLKELGPVVVTTRGDLDPDEKALLAALCAYSTTELVSRGV